MKKTLGKFLAIMITIAVVLGMNIPVFAAVSPENTNVYAGQVVTLTYKYNSIAGINGTFSYSNPNMFSDINFSIDGLSLGKYTEKTKSLAFFGTSPVDCTITLKLTVSNNAKSGESCNISLQYETTSDGNMPSVPDYKYDNATITIVEKIDSSELQSLIAQAEGLKKGNYLPQSWTLLETALKNAKDVLGSATTQNEINAAAQNLRDAISKLEKLPDYAELSKQLKIAESLSKADYTEKTWTPFAKAFEEAKKAKSYTKQADIDLATKNLKNAIAGLVSIYEGKLNFEKLNAQLKIADTMKANDYAKTGWNEFLNAYQDAKNAKNSKLQYEIDAAADALEKAIKALTKIDYSELSKILNEITEYGKNNKFLTEWNNAQGLLNEANSALTSRDQQTVDSFTKKLQNLLLSLKKAIAEMAGADSVVVEKPVVIEPNYDYCNISGHSVWIILFWISFAINIAVGALIAFYYYTKRRKVTDDTPLVDYDIYDDE